MKTNITKKGFTLIELLVVISIIGLLSSVVLAALSTARSKGRDAQRISSLAEVRKALTLYYDKFGYYPNSTAVEWSSKNALWNNASNPLYALVAQGFIAKLPLDPKNTTSGATAQIYENSVNYVYYYTTYDANTYTQNYDLAVRLENSGNPNSCAKKDPAAIDGSGFCNMHTYVGGDSNLGKSTWDGSKIVVDH